MEQAVEAQFLTKESRLQREGPDDAVNKELHEHDHGANGQWSTLLSSWQNTQIQVRRHHDSAEDWERSSFSIGKPKLLWHQVDE